MSEPNNGSGLYITRVQTFDEGELGVTLSNGNYVMLELKNILELPGFEILTENERFMEPIKSEDGKTIFWRDGPRPIGIDELLALIGKVDNDVCGNST